MILPPIIAIDSRRAATAAGTNTAGLCDPTTNVHYGDGSTDITASDTGIATYVGGNMYIGSPNGATWSADAINGSYAAEAEGQTVVRGDLLARPIKTGSDGKSFFTLGMVAFGAQYLPAAGTTILAVGGKVGSNPGAISTLGGGDTDHAQAWNAPVGIKSKATNTSKEYDYKAYIAGKQSTVWGDDTTPSVRAYTNTASDAITWSGTTGLKDSGIVGATKKQSDIASLSENLSSLTSTGVVTTGVAPTGKYTRYKYDSSKSYDMTFTNDTVNYTVGSQTYSGINNEKVLFFAGDGHSNNQVFNVTVSQLDSDGYRGLDFAFSNIPANASVIINVVKDDGSSLENTDTVSFNTGWRFWWNNDEISNGYVTSGDRAVDSSISNAYATAGESIMWNFGDAKSVTIGGGKAYEGLKAAGGRDDNASLDDPAAAMLGSILVPSGSFDDHATTNGRVWVGGDFMMNNPTGNANGASTASVIDMDQERHNLPWGMSSSSCSAIGWWKYGSDVSGVPVGGSSWGVFATYDDANNDTNAILYVTDDASNDWASANGRLEVHGLNINATYYVREVSPPDGYQNNDKVYTVSTTSEWAADSNKYVNGVYMVQGDTDSKGNPECGINIYNICDAPSSVSWKKVASDTKKSLSGSKWSLTNTGTNAEYEVDDLADKVTGLTFTASTGKPYLGLMSGKTEPTKVTVTPADVAIRYASTDPDVASIDSKGLVTGHAVGKAQVIAYAGDKTATIQVRVGSSSSSASSGSGDSISIRGASVMQPHEQQKLMLRQGGMALPDPSVATWTSSDATVATVNGGNVTTGACASASGCQVTITASYQGYTDTFNITVASSNVTTWKNSVTIYYYTPRRSSWKNYYLHYAFVKNGSAVFNNADIKMESDCSNWVKATVTNADALPLVVTFTDTPYQAGTTQTNAHWDSNNSKNYYLGAGYDTYVFDQESNGTNHTAPSCSVTSLSVTGNDDGTMTMQANTTSQLNATIEPAGAANVTWASDNTAVATVDDTGLVTARKAGTATITATAGGQQALINLTVRPQNDGEVIVDGNDEMVVGRTQTLTAQLDGEKDVTITSWESSKPAIATVDQTGRVTAHSLGTTTITATGYATKAGPGSEQKTGTMALTVVATPPYWNDVDITGGQFKVNGLPDGSYKLCETTPPSGYAADGTCYTFTLSAGEVKAPTIPGKGVTNVPTTVKWSKVDADDKKTTLDGSAWKITSDDGSKSVWCVADGGTTASKVANCTTSGSGSVLTDDDAEKGVIKVTGLPAGTYKLTETAAPKGYELSTASYTMMVSGVASTESTVDGKADRRIPNSKTYGRVSWAKYDETAQSDETHQALKGSDWQLFRCKSTVTSPSAVSSKVCKDRVQTFEGTSSSRFEYKSLLLNTYYLLVETKAPDGYLLGDAPYYAVKATSAATPATITPLSKDSAVQGQVGTRTDDGTYPIDNRKAATAKWKKTEYGSGTALEGSEWKLVQYADKKSSTTESSALRVYTITYTASTGSATQGSYAMSCTIGADSKNRCSARYAGKLSVTSPEGASALSVFSVSGLPWGYYMLTETKAPSGHLIGDDIAGKSVGGKTAPAVFTADYGTVTNEATITSLPMTGGVWTPRRVLIIGACLLALSAASYALARRSAWHGRRRR